MANEKFLAYPASFNSSLSCYILCSSSTCSLVCGPPIPPIGLPPHPPPPPSPPLSPPFLTETDSKQHLSFLVIIVVAVLVSSFLLVTYYAIIIKYFSNRNSLRGLSNPPTDSHQDHDQTPDPLDLIWYVRTVGLDDSVINSITKFKYKRDEGLIDGTDCSVCLNEFKEDEDLRLLPKCSHAFHLPCIDTWLKSHTNCPLCRANVVSNPTVSPPMWPNPVSTDSTDATTRVRNSQSQVELGGIRNQSSEVGVLDNHSALDGGLSEMGGLSSPRVNCGFRAQSDLIDNLRAGECTIEMMDDNLQPVRRSVSMDLSAAAMIMNNPPMGDSEGSSAEHQKSNSGESSGAQRVVPKHVWSQSLFKTMSRRSFMQKGPILMKRSFSGGSKFFLSRNSKNRNAILPL